MRHAVWARVASLPGPCRSALERLAVVPAGAELWLVEALLADLAVLEPAERRGILVASQHGIRFRHELARRAVEFSLPSVRRIEHHRRVLEALVAADAEPSRLVHLAAAAADDQAVARYAAAATEAARAEGHHEAAAFARLALERSRWLDRLELARLRGVAARPCTRSTGLARRPVMPSHVLLLEGCWDEAERRLRRRLEEAGDPGANLVNPLAFLGRILARRGDPEATALIERAWAFAIATGEDQKTAIAGGARIELAWLEGDLAGMRSIAPTCSRWPSAPPTGSCARRCSRYLRRAGEPVEPFHGCPPAFAAGITGDWATAARRWEETGNPYHQALELTGSPEVAVASDGLRILDRLGAVAAARLVRRRLRERGVRRLPRGPRAATRANPGRLTDRQLEVLACSPTAAPRPRSPSASTCRGAPSTTTWPPRSPGWASAPAATPSPQPSTSACSAPRARELGSARSRGSWVGKPGQRRRLPTPGSTSGDEVVERVVGPGGPGLHRRPGPVHPDGDRAADLVGVVAVLVHLIQPHLGNLVEFQWQAQPDRLALLR